MIVSLAAARVNAKMTQEEVSKVMRVSKSTIINWEKGKTSPKSNQLKQLCKIYKADINDIFLPNNLL